MTTMNALQFDRYGAPSVISLRPLDIPALNPGEVLIEIHAAAINPSDVKNVAGAFNASLPRVPGRDYAGVVVAGDAAWMGKAVWGSSAGLGVTRHGTHAEYLVVQADWLSEKPAHLTMPQAAAVGVPYLAAWMALRQTAAVEAGDTVLITGALGAVGRAATEIARWSGADVIGADRFASPPGADAWIDTRTMDVALEARRLSGGRGVDIAVDAVGGPLFEASLRSLRPGGRQVALTSVGNRRVEFDLVDFYHNTSHLIGIDTMQLSGAAVASILDRLRVGFDMGRLTPPTVTAVWPLARGIEAYSAVEAGAPGAKHVLAPVTTPLGSALSETGAPGRRGMPGAVQVEEG